MPGKEVTEQQSLFQQSTVANDPGHLIVLLRHMSLKRASRARRGCFFVIVLVSVSSGARCMGCVGVRAGERGSRATVIVSVNHTY